MQRREGLRHAGPVPGPERREQPRGAAQAPHRARARPGRAPGRAGAVEQDEHHENEARGEVFLPRQVYNGELFNGALYILVSHGVLYNGAPFHGALYIMVHHFMVRYIMVRHFMVRYM